MNKFFAVAAVLVGSGIATLMLVWINPNISVMDLICTTFLAAFIAVCVGCYEGWQHPVEVKLP